MPTYEWTCTECDKCRDVVAPVADRNLSQTCACGAAMERRLSTPMVMNHALPEGTKRFDGIRRAREAEREQSAERHENHKRLVELARQKEA